ncbi:uncharacterized protein LOC142173437 [Nicotiana tabacum]|uniref:Uncharacterized protein LOC142173437 n=1 Tax=Nicotiana tabacum TaxID=4097 RepID=A0AC58TD19_TOBAC
MIEGLKHTTTIVMVSWQRPQTNFVKVNTHGSELSNPSKVGIGVIVRDHQSQFIHVISSPLCEGTNNLAETEATIIGVKWCIDNGFTKIQIETDFNLLKQWPDSKTTAPGSLMFICRHSEVSVSNMKLLFHMYTERPITLQTHYPN